MGKQGNGEGMGLAMRAAGKRGREEGILYHGHKQA